ncbi:MAG: exonuclease SbcCD subunit D [Treponema sp.]|jgi:exonuclease SbcD|nr:exonuclease SbcCD subunit D [Treponema sp.]
MLKFLHTADLHLGKVFHEHSLREDQQHLLDGLREILEDPTYQALLIAGDVYDRSIPSPEAVTLLSSFLGKLKARRPSLEVLILPGNHDSSSRLGFGKELFAELGIHLITDPEDAARPILIQGSAGETAAFFLLPFLNPGSLKAECTGPKDEGEAEPLRSPGKLIQEAAARLEVAQTQVRDGGAAFTILGAHLFTQGGLEAGSERIFLGTAEQADITRFTGFDYIALGHLHRFQQVGTCAWYSGSPLAYSFEEAAYAKVFLSVTLEGGAEPRISPLPVNPLRKIRRLKGPFTHFLRDRDPLLAEAAEDYLEILLTDTGVVENPLSLLRTRFPFILSIKQDAAFAQHIHGRVPLPGASSVSGRTRSTEDDFEEFLMDIYGASDREKIACFRELLQEIEAEEANA